MSRKESREGATVITRPSLAPPMPAHRTRPEREVAENERSREVDARRARAIEEPLDVRVRRTDVYPILEVRNPLHRTAYRVFLPEFPSVASALCTCTDFARRGLGTCKHIEAGWRWLREHPDTPTLFGPVPRARRGGGAWSEVDRRLRALANDPAVPSLRYRRPGAALYEKGIEPST